MEEKIDTGLESTYNEALFRVKRINDAQQLMNTLRTNMKSWNGYYCKYNYEVFISNVLSLFQEVKGKLSDTELKKVNKLREIIMSMLDLFPVHETITNDSISGKKKEYTINQTNWNMIQKVIFCMEDYAQELIEGHGLGTPNTDEEALWD